MPFTVPEAPTHSYIKSPITEKVKLVVHTVKYVGFPGCGRDLQAEILPRATVKELFTAIKIPQIKIKSFGLQIFIVSTSTVLTKV